MATKLTQSPKDTSASSQQFAKKETAAKEHIGREHAPAKEGTLCFFVKTGRYQITERDYRIITKEYNPWMRVHTTNHCECRPRVRITDPSIDWRTCPGYQRHLIKSDPERKQNQEILPGREKEGKRKILLW